MKIFKHLFFLFIFCLASAAFGQSSSDLRRQKEALTREIESLNRSLNQTANNKNLSLKEIRALNAQIRLREKKNQRD